MVTPDAFQDFDGDGKPDAFIDFNRNGTPDAFEDFNGNGKPDAFEDADRNGLPDFIVEQKELSYDELTFLLESLPDNTEYIWQVEATNGAGSVFSRSPDFSCWSTGRIGDGYGRSGYCILDLDRL